MTKIQFKVNNIVASAKYPSHVNLEQFAHACEQVDYNPENFPAAKYRLPSPKFSCLVFRTGGMVATSNTVENLAEGFKILFDEILALQSREGEGR